MYSKCAVLLSKGTVDDIDERRCRLQGCMVKENGHCGIVDLGPVSFPPKLPIDFSGLQREFFFESIPLGFLNLPIVFYSLLTGLYSYQNSPFSNSNIKNRSSAQTVPGQFLQFSQTSPISKSFAIQNTGNKYMSL
jgi:hypothetical protein